MLRLTQLAGCLAGARRAAALSAWRYWDEGQANNGRPKWDTSPYAQSGASLPAASCAASAPNYGFMILLSDLAEWSTVTFNFSSWSGEPAYHQCFVSDVSTGIYFAQGSLATVSGNALTFTRSGHFSSNGTEGTGVSGAPPTACNYFGFGSGYGSAAATFTVSSIVIA